MVSDRLDAEDDIGGKKGLDALIRYVQENEDVVLCPAADFTRAQESGGSFLALFQAARNVSGSIAEAADFLPSTKTKNTLQDPGYYLNPAYSRNLLERFAARLKKRSGSPRVGIAVDGYGSLLYADAHTSVFDGCSPGRPAIGPDRPPSGRRGCGVWGRASNGCCWMVRPLTHCPSPPT